MTLQLADLISNLKTVLHLLLIDEDQQALKLTISPNDESRFGFEMSMTKMTPTVDYPAINLETFSLFGKMVRVQ